MYDPTTLVLIDAFLGIAGSWRLATATKEHKWFIHILSLLEVEEYLLWSAIYMKEIIPQKIRENI